MKVGDKVKILPENPLNGVVWTGEMKKSVGSYGEIVGSYGDCPLYDVKVASGNSWAFHENELKLEDAYDDLLTALRTPATLEQTLEERGKRYGEFKTHADITQTLKSAMIAAPKWSVLTPSQKEALDMIAHKIGRILNGDPNYADSWHDIAGYATLVEDELI